MSRKNVAAPFAQEVLLAPDAPLEGADFTWEGPDSGKSDEIARPSISYWKDAMRRLFANKTAVVCMVILVVILAMAIIVPMVSPYTISEQHLRHTNKGMMYRAEDGHVHIFGTDDMGRDLFTRIWDGARTSLFIAFTAVFVNLIVGVIYGSLSGYIGGQLDNIMMRFVEIVGGIPYLIIVILMKMMMSGDKEGIMSLVIAYASVGWLGMARLVRGQIMSLKEQEFVVAAKALGAGTGRIIARHLLPNLLSVVIINITLAIPSAIFTEAFLSFIGMGVQIPYASWGTLAQEGVRVFMFYPLALFLPAFFISITMLAFNLLGDGLRDAFDPRLRR